MYHVLNKYSHHKDGEEQNNGEYTTNTCAYTSGSVAPVTSAATHISADRPHGGQEVSKPTSA